MYNCPPDRPASADQLLKSHFKKACMSRKDFDWTTSLILRLENCSGAELLSATKSTVSYLKMEKYKNLFQCRIKGHQFLSKWPKSIYSFHPHSCPCVVVQNTSINCTFLDVWVYCFKERQLSNHQQIREDVDFFKWSKP